MALAFAAVLLTTGTDVSVVVSVISTVWALTTKGRQPRRVA
jgi:hypothetical protein